MSDNYAEQWAASINEVYPDYQDAMCLSDKDIRDVLNKAACALRGYLSEVTFTGEELDIVRHMMPAHEVHQSGSVRWVHDNYGHTPETVKLLNSAKPEGISLTGLRPDAKQHE
jgi:hypothetical protein